MEKKKKIVGLTFWPKHSVLGWIKANNGVFQPSSIIINDQHVQAQQLRAQLIYYTQSPNVQLKGPGLDFTKR